MVKKNKTPGKFSYNDYNNTMYTVRPSGDLDIYGWMTEDLLEVALRACLPVSTEILRTPTLPGHRYRPDFIIESLKLIFEYDGYRHYTSSNTIRSDSKKDALYKDLGYTLVRIPYFLQLGSSDIERIIGHKIFAKSFLCHYPQGFIHPDCVLPEDFCEQGVKRFKKEMELFTDMADEVYNSLSAGNLPNNGLPPSMSKWSPKPADWKIEDQSESCDEEDGDDSSLIYTPYYDIRTLSVYRNTISRLVKVTKEPELLDQTVIERFIASFQHPFDSFYDVYKGNGGTRSQKDFDYVLDDLYIDIVAEIDPEDDTIGRSPERVVSEHWAINQLGVLLGSYQEAMMFHLFYSILYKKD